nr:MAG TPA: DNA polymerase [Caudoviricetes sp.]
MAPRINYINQLNTFFKIAASIGLTATERALYQALLHKNNSLYWSESFTTPSSEILGLSGLSQSSMQRARKKLIQVGLITYKNRGSNRAPRYTVPELSDEYVLTILNSTSDNTVTNTPVNTPNNTVTNTSNTLNKQDETKLNETNKELAARAQIQKLYQQKIRPMDSPQNIDRVQSFLEDGVALEVILCAINVSARDGGKSAGYVVSKLNDWVARGVKSVEEAKVADEAWKSEVSKGKQLANTGSSEYDNLGW